MGEIEPTNEIKRDSDSSEVEPKVKTEVEEFFNQIEKWLENDRQVVITISHPPPRPPRAPYGDSIVSEFNISASSREQARNQPPVRLEISETEETEPSDASTKPVRMKIKVNWQGEEESIFAELLLQSFEAMGALKGKKFWDQVRESGLLTWPQCWRIIYPDNVKELFAQLLDYANNPKELRLLTTVGISQILSDSSRSHLR